MAHYSSELTLFLRSSGGGDGAGLLQYRFLQVSGADVATMVVFHANADCTASTGNKCMVLASETPRKLLSIKVQYRNGQQVQLTELVQFQSDGYRLQDPSANIILDRLTRHSPHTLYRLPFCYIKDASCERGTVRGRRVRVRGIPFARCPAFFICANPLLHALFAEKR